MFIASPPAQMAPVEVSRHEKPNQPPPRRVEQRAQGYSVPRGAARLDDLDVHGGLFHNAALACSHLSYEGNFRSYAGRLQTIFWHHLHEKNECLSAAASCLRSTC